MVTNATAFYANLEFFLGQREAWAKESGSLNRPSFFSHISLGRVQPTPHSPNHSVTIQPLESEIPTSATASQSQPVVSSPPISCCDIMADKSVTATSKQKLVDDSSSSEVRSVKRYAREFHLSSLPHPVDAEDSLPLAMWRGLTAHRKRTSVWRGSSGIRNRRQATSIGNYGVSVLEMA